MEAALDVLARRLTGTEAGPAASRRLPFDPVRRRESAIVGPTFLQGCPPKPLETGMELLGVIGLQDPPRPDVGEVIGKARQAGVKVALGQGAGRRDQRL